jgi:hypothetical protein
MQLNLPRVRTVALCTAATLLLTGGLLRLAAQGPRGPSKGSQFDSAILVNAGRMLADGRNTFRFDTFGDEVFWGDTLKLHQAIEGNRLGGVGPGISPTAALGLGLKVDVQALPASLVSKIKLGAVDLNDPATTLALLKLDAVVGVKGFFNPDGTLKSMGIRCSLCHSTVDNSLAFGIGRRLDGWANRDLNVGAIMAAAPDLSVVVSLLKVTDPTTTDAKVRSLLNSWGPGKFDAELFLDGKAINPTTGQPAATLIPNAYGLAGFNQHTWTGGWGSVPYWNALVAAAEMHGVGTFFDPRLDNAAQFPIAAAAGFGHLQADSDSDRITKKLAPLQYYQLSIPAPTPKAGVDFDQAAAERGDELFGGKAKCGSCHVEPLWTEPGWNVHKPDDIKIESFQADRAPDHSYKTMNLAGLFVREEGLFMNPANKGRYYHDGRFKTLLDVVKSYNTRLNLGLTDQEERDIVEYLKALMANGSAIG